MQAPAGVLVIDKPLGLTSHDVVQRVRRATGIRRVGHAGTLDPLATGLLIVCLGWATRLVEYVQDGRKTYETSVRLGQTTTTYDAEGEVIVERPVIASPAALEAALNLFRGPIQQAAPAYSAIKRDGQPLYKAARRGETIELPIRHVTIDELELLSFDPPHVALRVVCSPGTYIRSLAYDLGEALGCGGHVIALRRTRSGHFTTADACMLDALSPDTWRDLLLPPEAAVAGMAQLAVSAEQKIDLQQGRAIDCEALPEDGTLIAALGPDGRLLGIIEVRAGQLHPHKMAPTG